MSAIMLDILHILMSPPPVPGCVLTIIYCPFYPSSSRAGKVHRAYVGCDGAGNEEAKGNTTFTSVHFICDVDKC